MPEELLAIFKVCLLVLLYLFFFRVLRAVWTEVNQGPAVAGDDRRAAGGAPASNGAGSAGGAGAGAAAARASTGRGGNRPAAAPSSATTPTRLVAREPAHIAGLEYSLHHGMTLGRGATASVVLDDSFLSQQHVAFEQRANDWVAVDLDSTNGTFLNGERLIGPTLLEVGSVIRIGSIVLEAR